MQEKQLTSLITLENNTVYRAEGRIDVYPQDCFSVDDSLKVFGPDVPKDFPVAFFAERKENIVFDFGGNTLFLHGRIQPFLFHRCKKITIKNCVVEYERSLFTEGTVVRALPGYTKLRLGEKFPFRTENGNFIPYGETWENTEVDKVPFMFFRFFRPDRAGDKERLISVGKTHIRYWNKSFYAYRLRAKTDRKGNLILYGQPLFKHLPTGYHAVIEHENRYFSTVLAYYCDDFAMENVRILNGAGMGVAPICTHNVRLDGLRYTYDERSHGFVTNGSDGLHAVACSGTIAVKNSVFEGMIDDAVNIHGNFFRFVSGQNNVLTAQRGSLHECRFLTFREGDEIGIYKGRTLELQGKYRIREVLNFDGKFAQLLLDRPLAKHNEGDMIENLGANPDVLFKNCTFGKTSTHLRFQSRGKIRVEDCVTEMPFILTGDTTYWFESSPCTDFTVQNCAFVGKEACVSCCPEILATEQEPYYHKNITVRNCSFDTPHALNALSTDNIVFDNNTCPQPMTLTLKKCGACTTDCATIIRD